MAQDDGERRGKKRGRLEIAIVGAEEAAEVAAAKKARKGGLEAKGEEGEVAEMQRYAEMGSPSSAAVAAAPKPRPRAKQTARKSMGHKAPRSASQDESTSAAEASSPSIPQVHAGGRRKQTARKSMGHKGPSRRWKRTQEEHERSDSESLLSSSLSRTPEARPSPRSPSPVQLSPSPPPPRGDEDGWESALPPGEPPSKTDGESKATQVTSSSFMRPAASGSPRNAAVSAQPAGDAGAEQEVAKEAGDFTYSYFGAPSS